MNKRNLEIIHANYQSNSDTILCIAIRTPFLIGRSDVLVSFVVGTNRRNSLLEVNNLNTG